MIVERKKQSFLDEEINKNESSDSKKELELKKEDTTNKAEEHQGNKKLLFKDINLDKDIVPIEFIIRRDVIIAILYCVSNSVVEFGKNFFLNYVKNQNRILKNKLNKEKMEYKKLFEDNKNKKRRFGDESVFMDSDYTLKDRQDVYCELIKHNVIFVEHAPKVFRNIRKIFNIKAKELLNSFDPITVISNKVMNNFSEGKSGSFFCFTSDFKFVIKTLKLSEFRLLESILKEMHNHYINNKDTLIVKIYGMYEISISLGFNIYFLIMSNVLLYDEDKLNDYSKRIDKTYNKLKITQRYDIKGYFFNLIFIFFF